MSKQKRAYKYWFSPTDEQKRLLAQTFGCCRFVYNWGLLTRKTAFFQHSQKLIYNHLSAMLPHRKYEYSWLSEISSVPIQQSLRHLDRAYKNFLEGRAKYPTFKKRRNTQNATVNILAEGHSASDCGGSVRPVRAKARRATPVEAGNSHS